MIAPTSTIITITMASAIIPVVSAEIWVTFATGCGVGSTSVSVRCLAVAVGVTPGAALAIRKACKDPARKVPKTTKRNKITNTRGMWNGFICPASISETRLPASGFTMGFGLSPSGDPQTYKENTPVSRGVFFGGEGGIRTREPCGLHAFQACALSQLRDLSF